MFTPCDSCGTTDVVTYAVNAGQPVQCDACHDATLAHAQQHLTAEEMGMDTTAGRFAYETARHVARNIAQD